jgi:hypothetical protein
MYQRKGLLADIGKAAEVIVDHEPRLFIVHDRNRRVMTKHVKGFVNAQSCFRDDPTIAMENENPAASID